MTLKAILEAEGHATVDNRPDVIIDQDHRRAVVSAQRHPTLVLATLSDIQSAIQAMRKGVYGYLFVPFQPGEAGLMVARAAASAKPPPARGDTHEPPLTLAEAEVRHILDTLRRCRNNKTLAARVLGIGRNTLWRKLAAINAAQQQKGL